MQIVSFVLKLLCFESQLESVMLLGLAVKISSQFSLSEMTKISSNLKRVDPHP